MTEFDRTNVNYMAGVLGIGVNQCITDSRAIKCLTAMEKYSDKWWSYKDIAEVAYYQINEPVLLVSYSKFQAGLEDLLGRSVGHHEMEFGLVKLKKEAEVAFAKRFLGMKQEC